MGEQDIKLSQEKEFDVCLPITGTVWVSVRANTKEEAIDRALKESCPSTSDIEEWATHRMICEGNILHADTNEAYAVEA